MTNPHTDPTDTRMTDRELTNAELDALAMPDDDDMIGDRIASVDLIVEAMISVLRDRAFHEATIDQVAVRTGVTIDELERHFPTWDGLVLATYDRWNDDRMRPLMHVLEQHGTVEFLRAIVADNVQDPALMRLLVALLNISATPSHPLAPHLRMRYRQFGVLVRTSLVHDIEVGREPATMDPRYGSEQLVALYEGLQIQSMVRLDEFDLVAAFDRAVTRLRHGWGETYVPTVWEF